MKPVRPLKSAKSVRPEKIILGIDPGTARMGWSVIKVGKNNKTTLMDANIIQTHKDLDMPKRLNFLYKELCVVVKKHNPHFMVVEKIFFNTNAKTAMTVGQARGICLLIAAQYKLDFFEYTALQAKLCLTGYGRSDKKQMQEAVKGFLNMENIIKSDDANDAIAIALCFLKKDYLSVI